jgi:hypothetical protein
MKQSFKYDVVFSFLEKDEELAVEINGAIEDNITTFLYSKKQKEIAGKDGEEEFSKVFGEQARLVVVLYGSGWGETPWTRIEATAIRNRGYSDGYDFVIFIITEVGLQPPIWLSRNRLWLGLERYGTEGAAAVIESRVQELDGEVRTLTAADKVKQKAKEIEFEEERKQFLGSQNGALAAKEEVAKLFSEIRKIITEVQGENLKFRIDGDDRELLIFSSGYTLFLHWSAQYANSLDYAVLRVTLFKGSIPYKNRMPIEDPERLAEEKFYFDKTISGKSGWHFRRRDGDFLTTDKLVEQCITKLMGIIKESRSQVRE